AVSEIERYERVRIAALPPHAHVAGFAADDLSHLLAELMENATSFSPPDLPVEVSGWLLESGEVMLSVQDEGIGMAGDRLTRLNTRLAEFDPEATYDQEGEDGLGLGLYVVARLAHRHGVRVQLREQKQGGVAAVAVLPKGLLAAAPTAAVPTESPRHTGGHAFSLPGADAEANSNHLPARQKGADPLVALAEQAVQRNESEAEPWEAGEEPEATEPTTTEPAADEPAEAPAEPHVPAQQSPAETTMELLIPEPAAAPAEESLTEPPELTERPELPERAERTERPERTETPERPERPDPYAIGPDTHERARDEVDEDPEPVTDKGLPKRTPRITAPTPPLRRTGAAV
ncbi:sensor histidine kinase, partial [Streptomyces nigra]